MKLKRIEDYDDSLLLEYRTKGSKNKQKLDAHTETLVPFEEIKKEEDPVTAIGKEEIEQQTKGKRIKIEDPEPTEKGSEIVANVGKRVVKLQNYDDFINKEAKKNPSKGAYKIFTPNADSKKFLKDHPEWGIDYKTLWGRIGGKKNFFVQGEAGWAKSAIIKGMALKAGYTVITVYLDKALPEDLGGIPVTRQDEDGQIYQVNVMPVWAQYIYDHPETEFLLFLDELNQASNDVMNALMPITNDNVICGQEIPNYFSGGAGNCDSENELNHIYRPIMARLGLKPIRWITGLNPDPKLADRAWKSSFAYLHSQWDKLLDKKLIDDFEKLCISYHPTFFAAPRDIEKFIFAQLVDYKNNIGKMDDDDYDRVDVETIAGYIKDASNTEEGVQWDNEKANKFTSDMQTAVDKLAAKCYKFIARNQESETGRSFDEEDEEKAEKSAELNKNEAPESDEFDGKDTIDSLINMIAYDGEVVGHDDEGNPFSFPVTPTTIWELFENLDKTTMGVIESELKKRNLTWVYPDDKAAKDSGKFDKFYED